MAEYVWVYKDKDSFKVWGYDVFLSKTETIVTYYWGPCGKPMQQLQKKEHRSNDYWKMNQEVADKVSEKEREGYKRVRNGAYFDAVWHFILSIEEQMEMSYG